MAKQKPSAKEFLSGFITPEIRQPASTLQPPEVNPYARIGPLGANQYTLGNQVMSQQATQPLVNPEAM